MKKLSLVLVVSTMFFACSKKEQDGFTINGTLKSGQADIVYLIKDVDRNYIKVDSVNVEKGRFNIAGKIGFPELYYIQLDSQEKIPFFIQNSTITMEFNIGETVTADITGSYPQGVWNKYKKESAVFTDAIDQLYADWKKATAENDEAAMARVDSLYEIEDEKEKAFLLNYLMENSACVVSAYLTNRNAYRLSLEELETISGKFIPELDASDYTQKVKAHINTLKSVAVGVVAPEFTMENPDGIAVTLSSFKGNYLLIDFWASWCTPCRVENPNVVALYNTYKDKGFNILGVSFDTKKENWLKAVTDDGITWEQVSDLKGWNNRVGKEYGVRSIPHTVLLDPTGVIIEKNLRGEILEDKLKEIYE